MVRDSIRAKLPGADAMVPNSVLRILSDAQGGQCHTTLQYIDWLALQLIPDTAETEWLDRHGDIWLTNADVSTGRKMATLAEGTVTFTGNPGAAVPIGTQLSYAVGLGYEVLETVIIDASAATPGAIRALDPGAAGNLEAGTVLSFVSPLAGITGSAVVVDLRGGTDEENDDDLRVRVLLRIRQPPMGGSEGDYVAWSLSFPGVTRAWCAGNEMGMGTVTVRVMMDVLRADNNGFPTADDLAAITAYIDTVRPVTVKDFWVLSPIPQPVDVHIDNLIPDTTATRGAIEVSLQEMLRALAAPGQTIFAAWKAQAVMNTAEVVSFDLLDWTDDVMPSVGHMAVLGDIVYEP